MRLSAQLSRLLAVILVALVVAVAAPAAAVQPNPTAPPNEGNSPTITTLRANLESAAAAYIEAEAKLDASKQRQAQLEQRVQQAEAGMAKVREGVARYAAEAYKTGRIGPLQAMLNSSSPDNFLNRVAALNKMTQRDQDSLVQFTQLKREAAEAKAGIDREVAEQQAAADEMNKRKIAAEKALSNYSGPSSTRVNANAAAAANPAPRNSDGSWPKESCSEDDPTPASGCVTPRTLHALKEAQRVGFKWYVSCFRSGGGGEHPKGRACDFAAFPGGFENRSAGGSNRTYGDNLAGFYIKNAKALGVMYVIWYCQIWQVGIGWRRDSGAGSSCGDSPAGDHTNHLHVSIL